MDVNKKHKSLVPSWWDYDMSLLIGPEGSEEEIKVLLVGSGDPRHILKTIAGLQEKRLHVSSVIVHFASEEMSRLLMV